MNLEPLGGNVPSLEKIDPVDEHPPPSILKEILEDTPSKSSFKLAISVSSNNDDLSSSSDESDGEEGNGKNCSLGKRKRTPLEKFQLGSTSKRSSTRLSTPKSKPEPVKSPNPSPIVTPGKKRGTRCGNCPGCLREDCSKCNFCKDKPKFGGPGKKKQRCLLRTCSNFQHHSAKLAQKAAAALTSASKKNRPILPSTPSNGSPLVPPKPAGGTTTPSNSKIQLVGTKETPTTTKQVVCAKVAPTTPAAQITLAGTGSASPAIISPRASMTFTSPASSTVHVIPAGADGILKPAIGAVKAVAMDVTTLFPTTTKPLERKVLVTSLLSSTSTKAKVETPKLAASPKSAGKKPPVEAVERMSCIQCGRERSLNMARSSKFCSQRCIGNWGAKNPGKLPKEAVGDKTLEGLAVTNVTPSASPPTTESSSSSSSEGKVLPRALKNLQIDMAKPGTRLRLSESSESDEESVSPPPPPLKLSKSVFSSEKTSFINTLASMISEKQRLEASSGVPALTATASTIGIAKTSTPATKSTAKRSGTPLQLTLAKKARLSTVKSPAQVTPKSVSFNLNTDDDAPSPASSSPTSSVPSALDKIANCILKQPKKQQNVKIPPDLPMDVRQWTVQNVVDYFKSTSDCQEYVDLFESQEVDGIALLLLTHETLVKCMNIKLGRTLKIMNRVQELKRFHDHKNSK